MANLYTKTGDGGQTSLIGGSRVSKSSLRVECYGSIDEANSMLGLAYSHSEQEYVRETIAAIQGKLFVLAAELASDPTGLSKLKQRLTEKDVQFLENVVDTCTLTTGKQTHFVVPGTNSPSAALHVARTIVRRAERHIVSLAEQETLSALLIRYTNRLSDAVYALARLEETIFKKEQLREEVLALVEKKLAERDLSFVPLNLENMQRVAQRARKKATEIKVPIVFAAVDEGGNLVLLERMEDSLLASLDIAIQKAYTASALRRPTHELAEIAQPGGELYGIEISNLGKIILFGGGFPYIVDGRVVGGIGISGGTVEEDMLIARYALQLT